MRLPRQFLGLAAGLLAAVPVSAAPVPPVDFNREVRPLLAEHCFACHGPDAQQRKAKLRLDVRAEALATKAFIPGQSAASELVRRISTTDSGELMPPPAARKPLTPAQRELLQRWVAEGADYGAEHWAYRPLTRPAVPARSAANPLDAFIAAKLAEQSLHPEPAADRVTLLRRLHLDLTGLPPKPADVDAFVADASPEAAARVVERLLASPHYGERMAMHWLDLVRYADSRGYHSDESQPAAPFRDYVIEAFNRNLRFDQLTAEQLAGDLLPGATEAQRIASGYNRLLATTDEAGAQSREYLAKYAADRVRNLGAVWLGSTLGCAECHDHKYDPFTQREFYRLAAFFADLKETVGGPQATTKLPLPDHALQHELLRQRIQSLRSQLDTQTPALDAAQREWELGQARWRQFPPTALRLRDGTVSRVAGGLDVKLVTDGPRRNELTAEFTPKANVITGLRLQITPLLVLPTDGIPAATVIHPVVQSVTLSVGQATEAWREFVAAEFTNKTWQAQRSTELPRAGWEIRKRGSKSSPAPFALFRLQLPLRLPAGVPLTLRVQFVDGTLFRVHQLSAAFTSERKLPPVADSVPLPGDVLPILATEPADRTAQQRELLATRFRELTPELVPARQQLAEAERQLADLANQAKIILEAESVPPRVVRILPRGDWLNDTGEVVTPGVPAFLGEPANGAPPATRLDLARWLTGPGQPLVARVFVNRLWGVLLGRGLVTTMEDFGARSVPPTHPELLDWLAAEFIASGWDVKHMVRLIARSEVYQRASSEPPELRARDPQNAWFARQSRFRLDAELVRDQALAVSGLLVERVGGPSVRPYQPAGYWANLAAVGRPAQVWEASRGEGQYRRGLYTYWRRAFLHPSLLAFDAPARGECVSERTRSNTPQQALVMLNDPTYVEAARALAGRTLREGGASESGRLEFLWRLVLARAARPEEVRVLAAFHRQQAEHYAVNPAAAEALLGVGAAPVPKDLDRTQLAAWTAVARAVLNLHETITRN